METRSNNVFVGAVTLALIALAAIVIVWIAGLNRGHENLYDIYFRQSVDGLAKGATVTYAGVPAGNITQIELWKNDPGFVRVRVAVDDKIPVLQGTTATIQGSFTGVSAILLNGGIKGKPPITEPGADGEPVIPTKQSGLGSLLANAPELLDHLSALTERLTLLMSDENQKSISGILANTNRVSASLADASPEFHRTMLNLSAAATQATQTLAQYQKLGGRLDNFVGKDGDALAAQMRTTLASAQRAADALQATAASAQPATRELSQTTLPEAEAAIRDLRATTKALRGVTERIDTQGLGSLVGSPKLPDYKP